MRLEFVKRFKLFLFGKKYYQTRLLPLMALKRYGFEQYYSLGQIQHSAKSLGHTKYYVEELAIVLIGNPRDLGNFEKYESMRKRFGLQNGGAIEVLKVFSNIEKIPLDPFGRNQAAETTGGID